METDWVDVNAQICNAVVKIIQKQEAKQERALKKLKFTVKPQQPEEQAKPKKPIQKKPKEKKKTIKLEEPLFPFGTLDATVIN